MDAGDVAQRFENVRPTARGWSARCPAHADRANSLSIAVGDDGRTLLHCFAGCEVEAIAHAIGLSLADLFADPRPRSRSPRAQLSPLTKARADVLHDARRQLWARPGVLLHYALADRLRRSRRAVLDLRELTARSEDEEQTWSILATAARVETLANLLELELDELLLFGPGA